MENAQVKLALGGITLDHEFFAYINHTEKAEIAASINKGTTHLVSITDNGSIVFGAAIDLLNDRVHAREVSGNFHYVSILNTYCELIARKFNKPSLSFQVKRKAVIRVSRKYGFTLGPYGDYERAIV